MCSLAGVVGPSALSLDSRAKVEALHRAEAHRGPDDQGLLKKSGTSNIMFCHNRLAIQDLSQFGHQPMVSPSGAVLVYNGEIYNANKIKSQLENLWNFKSTSDTEVLLAAIEIWGESAISKLDGIFAFAFANSDNSQIILGRDRLGVKPLYFIKIHEDIWFSSESKSLGRVFNRGLDSHSFHEWAIYQFPVTDRTFYEGVHSVPSGSYLSIKHGKVKLKRYWNVEDYLPGEISDLRNESPNLGKELLEILDRNVSNQMISDVPVASFTSGGMDSSIVTALAANYGLSATYTGTYGLQGYDESEYSNAVGMHVGLPNNLIKISEQDFFSALHKVANSLDFPIAGPGSVGQYLVCKAASHNYKVLLSGTGGDELFLGYTRDRFPLLAAGLLSATKSSKFSKNEWNSISTDLRSLKGYEKMLNIFAEGGGFSSPIQGFMSVVDRGASTNELFELDPTVVNQVNSELLTKIAPNGANSLKEVHAALLKYEVSFFLASLLHVEDRVSMASGVEVRVPLLSTEVIEFLLPISLESRISGIRPKDLLRKIAVGLLPEKVLVRGDKMGFPVPLAKWAASSTPSSVPGKILNSIKEHKRAFVKTENVDSVMRKGGLEERGLWSLLMLESWYQGN